MCTKSVGHTVFIFIFLLLSTHLLVDRNGIVKKVTTSIEDLIPSLEKEIQESLVTDF